MFPQPFVTIPHPEIYITEFYEQRCTDLYLDVVAGKTSTIKFRIIIDVPPPCLTSI
jgi:hypothetical protein